MKITCPVILAGLLFLSACTALQPSAAPSAGNISFSQTKVQTSQATVVSTITASPIVMKADPTSPGAVATALPPVTEISIPTSPTSPTSEETPTAVSPDDWMTLPITPTVSQTARQIFQHGQEMGRDAHKFSKIGDCQSITTYFLSYFDRPGYYNLGPYSSLQKTIEWYSGSFLRESLAVKGGFNAAAILSPLRADPMQCNDNENPVACEIRLQNPSIAIISLEEWWAGHPENYEKYMRQIIEYVIQQGVIPIIATKADNLEGNNLINQTIAKLAAEYDIPLWNFWRAVQDLPYHGLIPKNSSGEMDMFHLTREEGYYFYNNPSTTQNGWARRNLTALEALDTVRRSLAEKP